MPGFGTALGAFGNAYPQYQQQQQTQQMNQLKLQEALRQMAQEQSNRKAQADALRAFSGVQGSGPGGIVTPQQMAGVAGGNPEAFNMLNGAVRPSNAGMYNLESRDITGQYGLQRTQMQGDNRMDAVTAQQEGANARNESRNTARKDIVTQQQEGANARNANSVSARKSSSTNPVNLASLPEFKTAKTQFEEAKKDERNIEAHYPVIAQAYNDPQWLDARKRAVAAQAKMEAIQTKAAKEAPAAPAAPVKITNDDEYNKLASGTPFIDPEGNVRTKP